MNMDPDSRAPGGHVHAHVPLWRSRGGLVQCGFLLIAGVMLLTGHQAHLLGALPFLLLLACPLMHLFMHHGHGGHGSDDGSHTDGSSS